MTNEEMWTYRSDAGMAPGSDTADMTGFAVEAVDGSIGKIDEATYEAGSSYLVIDTGPWIFGQKVVLPAQVVTSVDQVNETVFVDRTKDEIKDAPPFDEATYHEPSYREDLGAYYSPDLDR